ncbi:hypothetical protein [Salinisphaera sp. G21_0]|uniref:hypothetical protein n=1 Tax=Salinisphaera sp. G21_0 TaxID=2821094 RepID=UPI001AD9B133|nr:hypothetical protein [Salinisphaera sp. G21_0]MBO9484559.1 hypothetical protein [Salinisphaera sp. G21_0]
MTINHDDVKLSKWKCETIRSRIKTRPWFSLIQEGQLSHGRPIILSGNGEAGWVSRLTVKNLFALSKAANKTMTLTLPDSRQFSVIFDRSNGAPVEAKQVLPFAYPADSDQYLLTLRLLTVHSG